MPSGGTGAVVANRKMIAICISGRRRYRRHGIGQFVPDARNLPIVYVIGTTAATV